jgi:hypothetical protein
VRITGLSDMTLKTEVPTVAAGLGTKKNPYYFRLKSVKYWSK